MDIHDMIQTCDLLPSEDTTRRLLDICMALNKRLDTIEADAKREELRAKRHGPLTLHERNNIYGHPDTD